jgi:hypothetical protein
VPDDVPADIAYNDNYSQGSDPDRPTYGERIGSAKPSYPSIPKAAGALSENTPVPQPAIQLDPSKMPDIMRGVSNGDLREPRVQMLLLAVQRIEPGSVISMPRHAIAIKKGQNREKTEGFREMGILRCDGCGEEFFIGHDPASVDKKLAKKQAEWLEKVLAEEHER